MVKAEEAFSKAYTLRLKKGIAYEERLKHYHEACDYFLKAHRFSERVFTLNRIESAAESCMRIRNFDAEENFRTFEEKYIKTHPQEVKYGDAGPFMNLE